MQQMTRVAIVAILNADNTATDEERRRVELAVEGEFKPLTVCEAAERMGVSRPTVYALVRAGRLKRTGKRISGRSVAEYFKG